MNIDFKKLRISMARRYNTLYKLSAKIEDTELCNAMGIVLDGLRNQIVSLLCLQSDNERIDSIDLDFDLLPVEEE